MIRFSSLFLTREKNLVVLGRGNTVYFQNIYGFSTLNAEIKGQKIKNLKSIVQESLFEPLESEEKVEPDKNLIKMFRKSNVRSTYRNNEILIDTEQNLKKISACTPSKAIDMLKFLHVLNHRPLKVLHMVSEKVIDSPPESLDLKNCSDLLFSMGKMSYRHEELIDKVAKVILSKELTSQSPKFVASIVHSIGVLKYKNEELIETLIKFILKSDHPFKNQCLLISLMTLALVNMKTPFESVLVDTLSKCNMVDFRNTKSFLDFVWACVLLNHLSVKHISEVLSEKFINQLDALNVALGSSIAVTLKLQNINAAADFLLQSYKGPRLIKSFSRPPLSKNKHMFLSIVVDGLTALFPKRKFLKTLSNYGTGFFLDAEFSVDSNCEAAMLSKDESFKVAIILLDFNDICLGKDKAMTGLSVFKKRILEAKGYKVVLIPFNEYTKDMSLLAKTEYLKNEVKVACDVEHTTANILNLQDDFYQLISAFIIHMNV